MCSHDPVNKFFICKRQTKLCQPYDGPLELTSFKQCLFLKRKKERKKGSLILYQIIMPSKELQARSTS